MHQLAVAAHTDQLDRPHSESKPRWVYRWTKRYESGADRWYQDRSHRPHVMARQVSASFERLVVRMHCTLKGTRNPLGFCGAEAIYHELADLGVHPVQSIRTIHRILVRHALVTRPRRDRSRKGSSLPCPMAQRQNDVHQVNFIVEHYWAARRPVEVDRRVQHVLAFLMRDWQRYGRPRGSQLDNDRSLTGGRMHARSLGQLVRFCLACRGIPVFTPERRPASNAAVERYNGLWQEKVWQRPDPGADSGAFPGFSERVQYLPDTKIAAPREAGSVQDSCAIFARASPLEASAAALPGADLVDQASR